MAGAFETCIARNGEELTVNIGITQGNRRNFRIPTIPLECAVIRSGSGADGELHFSVTASKPVSIPMQELYGPADFNEALDDSQMHGHVNFVVDEWMRQTQ
jgi:hypothetical protein